MTQPMHNPYGQGAYGQQPYGQPQFQQPQPGQQYPQQTYGPTNQQAGYQPGQQSAAPAQPQGHQHAPSFDDAEDPSGFGGLFARPRHLLGRVVIYMPKRVDSKAKGMDGNPKETPNVHGDLLVVDGGMIQFGDKLRTGGIVERPCTHQVMAPAFFSNVIVGETQVALALQQAAPPFGNGLMVGVIVRGTKGNLPYLLQTLPGDDPRRAQARQLYDAWRSGTWQSPEPEPIQAAPGSQAQQYTQPAQQPAGGVGGPTGQWGQPQTMGGQMTAWQGQQAPQNVPASAPPAQWGSNPGQVAQTPQGFSIDQPAPGWDPAMWAQMPEANRQQIWALVQQQAAGGQQATPGAMSTPTGF